MGNAENSGSAVKAESNPKGGSAKRVVLYILIGAVLCVGVYFAPDFMRETEKPSPTMRAGGTSVVSFMMDQWGHLYHENKGVRVYYESTGSTEGLTNMIDKKFSIGFTHAPMSEEQMKKAKEQGGDVVQVPVILCGVVPIYNIKELAGKPPLNFTGEVLGKIFTGEIDKWNHEDLKNLNKGVTLPNTKITVVHREDSSGTTLIFTQYLLGASKTWMEKMKKAGSVVKWPVGEGQARNNGVAFRVPQVEGAIGYVDLLFAKARQISYGAVQNKDATAFIHAEPKNLTAATAALMTQIPDNLMFDLIDQPGTDAYPIAGAVWAVCYQVQPTGDQKNVADFLHWVLHEGQAFAKDRTYAPLPPELVERADQKLKMIQAK